MDTRDLTCSRDKEEFDFFLVFLIFQGYGYFTKGEVLRVCKDALVVMKWKPVNSFYHFQGSTIIDSTSVSSMAD